MYLRGCLSAFLSYPLSNLLILKGKKSDPTPPKSIPSHPSHPCALQCKASSYPGSPSNTLPFCLYVCSCVCRFTLRAYLFAHISLCLYVSLATSYLPVMPQPALGRRHLSGWSGSAAAKIPQTHRRKWQQLQNMEALPGQPVTKEKSSRYEGNVKISQIHQPCLFFVLDWQRSVCNTLKFCG